MGYYAIESAENLHNQLSQIYPEKTSDEIWQMIGITPMIGLNDVITERFTLLNAQQVRLNFFLGHVDWPLTVYLMIALFLGCIIGLVVGFLARRTRKAK